jgi:DNA-nicking Smr family endonuclease
MAADQDDFGIPQSVELPVDGVLDLHAFRPGDVKDLVPDYLALCRERGILEVCIIHGKGTGKLRRRVHVLLERMPQVAGFREAAPDEGGWGATVVTLRPPGKK